MKPYKTLCFRAGEIPDALLREHSLKAGVRGELRVTQGELMFVHANGKKTHVSQGERVPILPESPHHLEEAALAAIEIDFFRTSG